MVLYDDIDAVGANHNHAFVHIRSRDSEETAIDTWDSDIPGWFVVVPILAGIGLGADGEPWISSLTILIILIRQGYPPAATSMINNGPHRNDANTSPCAVILELKEHRCSEFVRDWLDSDIVIEVPDRPRGAYVSVKLRRNALNAVCDKGEAWGGNSPPPLIRNRSASKNDR